MCNPNDGGSSTHCGFVGFSYMVKSYSHYAAACLSLVSLVASANDRIKVLVIDTGVDLSNPRIQEVLCPNEDHLTTAKDGGSPLLDRKGHGTHISGIIRALAGNKGYCLAICRYYSDSMTGLENLIASTKCLKHASTINAQIVNFSGGGPEFNEEEFNTIKAGNFALFTAAGNESQDFDKPGNSYYPGGYKLPNVISVGSVDIEGKRTHTTNFGASVKLHKPGENIYSALPGQSQFGYMSGTSQATAVATGDRLRALLGLPELKTPKAHYVWLINFWRN